MAWPHANLYTLQYIYIYMYIVFDDGVLFAFHLFGHAPGHAFKNGARASCRSHSSGVYLVFEVAQGIWHSNKKNPGVSL